MADVHTPEQRSYNMSRIHSKNTKPEEFVRKFLFSQGFRYRKNDTRLPGKPGIVLPKYKTVVFVNGCFWHGHEGCRYFVWPKNNAEFWKEKITGNIQRDKRNHHLLEEQGWRVRRIIMGLFDVFDRKQEKKIYSPQEIVELARTHKPDSIYEDGHLIPEVRAAVNQIMYYDGITHISTMLILNNPVDMQNKMKEADVDTLLIFFKFLAIKASETNDNQLIGVVQQYLISVLQRKLQ